MTYNFKKTDTIKKITFLLTIMIVLILTLSLSASANNGLDIDKVTVYVNGDKELSTSSNTGKIDVEPGDKLRVEIKLENLNSYSSNNDFDNVDVEAVIYEIDDGNEESDSEKITIRADRSKTVTLYLDIPKDASSRQNYDLEIIVSGLDIYQKTKSDSLMIDVDVEREDHELIIETFRIVNIDCNGDATVYVSVRNAGEEKENDVYMSVKNSQLGQLWSTTQDIPGIKDDSNDYTISKRIDLSSLQKGDHIMTLKVKYDDGRKKEEKTTRITLQDCTTDIASHKTNDNLNEIKNKIKYKTDNTKLNSAEQWEKEYAELVKKRSNLELVVYDTEQETQFSAKATEKNIIKSTGKNNTKNNGNIIILIFANLIIMILIISLVYRLYL